MRSFFSLIFLFFPYFIFSHDYIIVLKTNPPDIDPVQYVDEQIDLFFQLVPFSRLLFTFPSLITQKFFAFSVSVNCNENNFEENLERISTILSMKFYEKVSKLFISSAEMVTKTIPFVSQYLRSEMYSLGKNGFCTLSYETYEQFLHSNSLPTDSEMVCCCSSFILFDFLILWSRICMLWTLAFNHLICLLVDVSSTDLTQLLILR
jgi:hypothetical protein